MQARRKLRLKDAAKPQDAAKPYEPLPHEVSAIESFVAALKEAPHAPRMKVWEQDGVTKIAVRHPDPDIAKLLLMKALGTNDLDFLTGVLNQLENATSDASVNEFELNFMLSVIEGMQPRDQVEAMLAAQLAITHITAMKFGGRLSRAETIMQMELAYRAFCKLSRTFAAQVEVLRSYRSKGEQKVRAEDIQPNAGDESALETPAVDDSSKSNGHYHGKQNGHAPQPALRRSNSQREPMSGTSHAERPLPHARRHVAGSA
jgi:hypothetical protein